MASPVKTIVINVCDSETRIALTEGGKLKTIIIEQQSHLGMVGNIYKGRVTRVIPGIQSAFIDIGLDRAGFLYFDDVIADPKSIKSPEIEKHLREGQEVIVQVNKDPLGTKGARVSMHLALAGRYLVFLPNRSDVNLSKKITEEQERKRLSELSNDICPKGHGMIIRTAAEGVVDKLIKNDLKALEKKWGVIEKSKAKTKTPGLIYREQEVSVKTIRDLYTQGVEKIIVDDKEVYQELKSFLKHSIPEAEKKLQHFKKQQLIFDYFEIENQLTRAIRRKVWLPSGGYLYVESTEALTTFDINTGRYIGEQAARQTILNTNLEAAVEVAAQLELRNIGGIIVIDFIDMDYPEDREKVLKTFTERLERPTS